MVSPQFKRKTIFLNNKYLNGSEEKTKDFPSVIFAVVHGSF